MSDFSSTATRRIRELEEHCSEIKSRLDGVYGALVDAATVSVDMRNPERSIVQLVRERDKLRAENWRLTIELDPPSCRTQFPDGTVPANAREAIEGWKNFYDEVAAENSRLKQQLYNEQMQSELRIEELRNLLGKDSQ